MLVYDLVFVHLPSVDPSNDPEISQAGIDLVYRMMPKHIRILLAQDSASLEFFFFFALKALSGKDILPKTAAADFWVC